MRRFILLGLIGIASLARADTIKLTSGSEIDCTILAESGERVTFRKGVSTFSVPRDQVASIERSAPPVVSRPPMPDLWRLPGEGEVVTALAREPWAAGLEQIPATVIDKGVLRNVPYLSHRCGDYEVNVYGDPDAPCCVEIGVYRELLSDPAAKERCVGFVAVLVGRQRAAALAKLNRAKDSATVGGWTVEITPPTDEGAYGGWWVSVYSEKALAISRASASELKLIAVDRRTPTRSATPNGRTVATRGSVRHAAEDGAEDWTVEEMGQSRPPSSDARPGGGAVFIRGYTRKDGTYVAARTRSAPARGGKR